ncbi:MAG: hypothetical protein ACTHLN_09020 [Tepidisphaeraceae bacterium]
MPGGALFAQLQRHFKSPARDRPGAHDFRRMPATRLIFEFDPTLLPHAQALPEQKRNAAQRLIARQDVVRFAGAHAVDNRELRPHLNGPAQRVTAITERKTNRIANDWCWHIKSLGHPSPEARHSGRLLPDVMAHGGLKSFPGTDF